jgi:chemosensory pili system protein ChpC
VKRATADEGKGGSVSERFEVVPSILIPVQGDPLLLPCAVVAEVVRYLPPERAEAAPDWWLGYARWRDRPIPIVSFEAACGHRRTHDGTPTGLVVLNVLRGEAGVDFYALVTAGTPHLLQITDKTISEREGAPTESLVSRGVLIKGEPARIPDLPALERLILAQATETKPPPLAGVTPPTPDRPSSAPS